MKETRIDPIPMLLEHVCLTTRVMLAANRHLKDPNIELS